MVGRRSSRRLVSGATCLLVFVVSIAPVIVLGWFIAREEGGLGLALADAFAERRQWFVLGNTLLVSLGASLAALILGASAALTLQYCPRVLREALAFLLCLPILLPPYALAVAWLDVMTRTGLIPQPTQDTQLPSYLAIPSVIAILALAYYPLVLIATGAALRRFDRRMLESARLVADPVQTFFAVRLPLLAPWMFTGTGLVFLLALTGFRVPALFQVDVYSVEILSEAIDRQMLSRAGARSLPLLAAGGIVLWLWHRWAYPRHRWLSSPGARVGRIPLGWKRPALAAGYCAAVISTALAAPLTLLAARVESLALFEAVWTSVWWEVGMTMVLACLTATLVTVLAFAMAYTAHSRIWPSRMFHVSVVPFLMTSPLLGTSLLRAARHTGPGLLLIGTVFVLACAAQCLYFAYQAERLALKRIPRELLEAAAVYDVSWERRASSIAAPMTAPVLAAVWGIMLICSLRELDALVWVPRDAGWPLSLRMNAQLFQMPSPIESALCLLLAGLHLVAGAVTVIMYVVCKKVFHAHH